MRLATVFVLAVCMSLSGCLSFGPNADYASLRLQNNADVKVSWVSIGQKPYKSDFGILGSKGAGKTAVVPVCYAKPLPIHWREGPYEHGVDKYFELDLRAVKGCQRLTIFYSGNDVWGARPGDATTDNP